MTDPVGAMLATPAVPATTAPVALPACTRFGALFGIKVLLLLLPMVCVGDGRVTEVTFVQ